MDNLAQQLECPICLAMLKRPVTLPCGHSFCCKCLSSLLSSQISNEYCPLCRSKIPAIDLKVNLAMQSIIRIINPHQETIKIIQNKPSSRPSKVSSSRYYKWGIGAGLAMILGYSLATSSWVHSVFAWVGSAFTEEVKVVTPIEQLLAWPSWLLDRMSFMITH